MFKRLLVALAMFLLPVTGAFAQTNENSAVGFYLAQGSTYGTYTCPSTQITPCWVQYGSTVPVSGSLTPSGTQDVNVKQVGGVATDIGTGAAGTGTQRVATSTDSTIGTVTAVTSITNAVTANPSVLTTTSSSALAANLVVNAAASKLASFTVSADTTLNAATWYVMLYNATSAPVDGAVTPVKCYVMPSGTTSFSAAFPNPISFSTGVVIGVSTTGCFTKTASTHALFISGDYR